MATDHVFAGPGSNMRRFLSWRFNLKLDHREERGERHEVGRIIKLLFTVISHSDSDHYEGFQEIFDSRSFKFDTVYHNTLVERPASKTTAKLGQREKIDGRSPRDGTDRKPGTTCGPTAAGRP